jgi:hypothetical protein
MGKAHLAPELPHSASHPPLTSACQLWMKGDHHAEPARGELAALSPADNLLKRSHALGTRHMMPTFHNGKPAL